MQSSLLTSDEYIPFGWAGQPSATLFLSVPVLRKIFLRPRTHGNVFLRFCIVSSNELVVLDSLEDSKQYKNAGKRFRVYGS